MQLYLDSALYYSQHFTTLQPDLQLKLNLKRWRTFRCSRKHLKECFVMLFQKSHTIVEEEILWPLFHTHTRKCNNMKKVTQRAKLLLISYSGETLYITVFHIVS